MTDQQSSTRLEIPWQQLSEEALQGMLEELVTRDGTDYGAQETPIATRVAQLRQALVSGRAVVTFCPDTETWAIAEK